MFNRNIMFTWQRLKRTFSVNSYITKCWTFVQSKCFAKAATISSLGSLIRSSIDNLNSSSTNFFGLERISSIFCCSENKIIFVWLKTPVWTWFWAINASLWIHSSLSLCWMISSSSKSLSSSSLSSTITGNFFLIMTGIGWCLFLWFMPRYPGLRLWISGLKFLFGFCRFPLEFLLPICVKCSYGKKTRILLKHKILWIIRAGWMFT